jgi:hypothetical protein
MRSLASLVSRFSHRCVCVRACVRARVRVRVRVRVYVCLRACVRVCVRVCVRGSQTLLAYKETWCWSKRDLLRE